MPGVVTNSRSSPSSRKNPLSRATRTGRSWTAFMIATWGLALVSGAIVLFLACVTGSSHVKAFRLRGLRPQRLGPFHGHRALRACPPLIIDLVTRPHHQRADFRRIANRVQGLTTYEAWCLTLRNTVSIQEALGLVDSIRLGPVMGQHADHEFPLLRDAGLG